MRNADVNFQAWDLQCKFYTIRKVLPTTVRKKEFAVVAFSLNHKAFVVYVAVLDISLDAEVYPSIKAYITHLKADGDSIKVSSKYADIFSLKLTVELPQYTCIGNDHAIEVVDN